MKELNTCLSLQSGTSVLFIAVFFFCFEVCTFLVNFWVEFFVFGHPTSTQGSPQVNLDCTSLQPILESLVYKPLKVWESTALLFILQQAEPMDQHLNRLFDSVSCLAPLITSTLHDGGLPRVLCVEGQFACRSFGCVDSAQVCDGRQDCLDGSDEEHCGTHQPPVREQGASKYRGLP